MLTWNIGTDWYDFSNPPELNFDHIDLLDIQYQAELEDFFSQELSSTPTLLSSTAIEWSVGSYTVALTGTGFGPVSSFDDLLDAIDNAVATGALNALTLTDDDTVIGSLEVTDTGLLVTSGYHAIELTGVFPTTFNELYDVASVAYLLGDIAEMQLLLTSPDLDDIVADMNLLTLERIELTQTAPDEDPEVLAFAELGGDSVLTLNVGGYELEVLGTIPNGAGDLMKILAEVDLELSNVGDEDFLGDYPEIELGGIRFTDPDGTVEFEILGDIQGEGDIETGTINLFESVPGADDQLDWPFFFVLVEGLMNEFDAPVANPSMHVDTGGGHDSVEIWSRDVSYLASLFDTVDFSIDGGDGIDRLVVEDLDYFYSDYWQITPPDDSDLVIDMANGLLTQAFTGGPVGGLAGFEVAFENFEELDLEVENNVTVLGTDNDDFVQLDRGAAFLHFDGGAGSDTLDASNIQVEVEPALFQDLSQAIFEASFDLAGYDLSLVEIFWKGTDDKAGELVDVETVIFADGDGTVSVDILDLLDSGGGSVGDPLDGTGAGETLTGTTSAEVINALGGADWIEPGGGNDTIHGGNGRDMLSLAYLPESPGRAGGQFRVYLDMEEGVSENHDGSERIEFTSIERLTSTIFTDLVRGTPGDDHIRTLGDYDWIVATEGEDTYDGGTGNDMISFLEFEGTGAATPDFFEGGTLPPADEDLAGVRVDLTDPSNNTGLAANKTLISIERVTGSSFQDVFVGDDSSNNLRGMGGYDWFVASDGGRERYFGGNGIDTVTYHVAPGAITASLINGVPNDDGETGFGSQGWAKKDLYFSIENLVGSAFDDSLEGSSGKNQLSGMDGDDIIFGLAGGDQLKGGLGDDTLNGGAGSDRAMYDFDRDEYTITRTASKTVTISHAVEGTDALQDVEYFEFADITVDVWSLDIV